MYRLPARSKAAPSSEQFTTRACPDGSSHGSTGWISGCIRA